MMKGSYAFAIMVSGEGERIYATRCGSPLIVGKGADGFYLASDITALLPFTRTYYSLREGEILTLERQGVHTTGQGICWQETTLTPTAAQKGGYEHFMLKEMWEQPRVIKECLRPRIVDSLPNFKGDGIGSELFAGVSAIHMVACGSAMHAGLVGVRLFEDLAKTPAISCIASEYRYHPPIADFGTLVILISQSGETADTLAALRYAKKAGLRTLAIVNAVETTIAREADKRIYTHAGPEIAVATTKGYCTQVATLYMIAAAMARAKGLITDSVAKTVALSMRDSVPGAIRHVLDSNRPRIKELSKAIANRDRVFYIGRGTDLALSEEGALKLKEISYIHAEAYAAGELKHGTISLIEKDVPVIAISTDPTLFDKTEAGVREVMSRGARILLLCRDDAPVSEEEVLTTVALPTVSPPETFFSALAVIQLVAYETDVIRGCDVDRPRNLAKSVTVE
jgi:glucosamine--fructose-6-phosphate aminotransferase (isomerizing)